MRDCPLAVDWLDLLEGRPSVASYAHLDGCPACRALTERLTPQMDESFTRALVATGARASRGRALLDTIAEPDQVAQGQIWWTASTFASDLVKYEQLDKLPVVIVHVDETTAHCTWVDVAPMWGDWENATATDLLLDKDDTTTAIPWRVLFRHQTTLERGQLGEYAGDATTRGIAALRCAIAGVSDLRRSGPELEGANDPRLLADEWIGHIMTVLGRHYAASDERADAPGEPPVLDHRAPGRVRHEPGRAQLPRRRVAADSGQSQW